MKGNYDERNAEGGAAYAEPPSLRIPALFQQTHLEGAHEHNGHALAGDVLAGPEVLARRLVVALDEALSRRPGEGAARSVGRKLAVQERRQVAPRGVELGIGRAQAGEDGDELLEADVVVRGEVLRAVLAVEARDHAAFHGPVGGGGVVMEIMIREELCI